MSNQDDTNQLSIAPWLRDRPLLMQLIFGREHFREVLYTQQGHTNSVIVGTKSRNNFHEDQVSFNPQLSATQF